MITTHRQPEAALQQLAVSDALNLVQAVHGHLDPEAVLRTLWGQSAALISATGLGYRHAGEDLAYDFGEGPHSASYTLDHPDGDLGELTVRFRRKAPQRTLAATEEIIALAVPALRNALAHRTLARNAPAAQHKVTSLAEAAARRPRKSLTGSAQDDALVLVSLDGYQDICERHGENWGQTLIQTIHQQLQEGLRDADNVFQIDEGLLAVLLPRTNEEAALDVAAKIRILIAGLHLRDGRLSTQLTACMGVAGARSAQRPEEVLERAQAALAQARSDGPSSIRTSAAQPRVGSSG